MKFAPVPIEQLRLWHENPRFEPVDDETDAIEALLETEKIDILARDIARYGLSPVERLFVFPNMKSSGIVSYFVADGNRRVCALKLLRNPKLAPVEFQEVFNRISLEWENPVTEVEVAIVEDTATRDHWLRRLHDGEQAGKGQRRWSTDQKSRFNKGGRNKVAVDVLDYAVSQNLIDAAERKGATSHLDRLIRNPAVKELLAISTQGNDRTVVTARDQNEFNRLLKHVVQEATSKSLGSQASSGQIRDWVRQKRADLDPSNDLFEAEPISNLPDPGEAKEKPTRREKMSRNSKIQKNSVLEAALEVKLANKLLDLYQSLCGISVSAHPLLVSVGIWSMLETLGANLGKKTGTSFADYFNASWMERRGLGSKLQTKGACLALRSFLERGNITKHDAKAGHYDAKQMINDMHTITPFLIAAVQEMKDDV